MGQRLRFLPVHLLDCLLRRLAYLLIAHYSIPKRKLMARASSSSQFIGWTVCQGLLADLAVAHDAVS